MPSFSTSTAVLAIAIVLLLARPAHAFGAGNIASVAKIEGVNWRHGDIEDTLLTLLMSRAAGGKKFDKMMVKRVYFGNWLRDYSQAIDVGTVKYVSAEAIRILLWVLGFMTFGYGTREFEVTADRLGCYRPEDHIDNPKDYADNLDATDYDHRLRGPVNERVELAIDPQTGLKNYIANERVNIMTSALHVRKLFTESIRLGRSYARSNNKDELYESLRLLGTALHCLEDYSAHSNYTELALIEMGERDVFPHVGRRTKMRLPGVQNEVYPCITGTFGGVDFLHSVMGEFSDKATQSEIEELEGTMGNSKNGDTSFLKELLNKVPSGLFGDKDEAGKADELQQNAAAAQMNQMRVSPRQPEAFTKQMQETAKEIYPIIQWHDEVMQSITEAIEKIPVLPDLIEQIEEQINIFVFSLLAPFVLPVITQIKNELNTGSSEIIQSSKDKQLVVFHDDQSTDPTHSMISKDHFSNILNEPAGKIASQVIKWTVPQIIQCMDDERVDVNRTIDRIIHGVFHHPAQRTQGDDGARDCRGLMFGVVENWWREQSEREKQGLRRQLSREGVQNGENHKEGVQDTGHGCGKPLGMAKNQSGGKAGKDSAAGMLMGALQSELGGGKVQYGGSSGGGQQFGGAHEGISKFASEAAGGGAMGGLVGALAGGIGGSLLAGAFGGKDEPEISQSTNQGYTQQGNYQQSYTETGHSGNQYAQAQYSETQLQGGGRQQEYQRYEQSSSGHGQSFEQRSETRPTYGGGYEQTNERVFQRPDGEVEQETWKQGRTGEGREYQENKKYKSKKNDSDDDDSNEEKKKKKQHKKRDSGDEGYGGRRKKDSDDENEGYGGRRKKDSDDEDERRGGRKSHGYESPKFGGGGRRGESRSPPKHERRGSPPRQEFGGGGFSGGRNEYEQPQRQEYGGSRFGGGRNEYQEPPRQEHGGGGFGRRNEYEQPQRQEYGGGGGFGGGRDEYEQPQRQGFGGGREEYGQPPQQRQEYGMPGGFGGDEENEGRGGRFGGRGGRGDEYQEERREERRW